MRHSTDRRPTTPATLRAAVPAEARRAAIEAAVEAHNTAHLAAPLPRSATWLLLAMFPLGDEFTGSQETLRSAGFSNKQLGGLLQALIAAGLLSRQPSGRGAPTTYRLLLP